MPMPRTVTAMPVTAMPATPTDLSNGSLTTKEYPP